MCADLCWHRPHKNKKTSLTDRRADPPTPPCKCQGGRVLGKGGLQTPEPVMDVDSMETGQPLLAPVFFQLAAQSSSTHPPSA